MPNLVHFKMLGYLIEWKTQNMDTPAKVLVYNATTQKHIEQYVAHTKFRWFLCRWHTPQYDWTSFILLSSEACTECWKVNVSQPPIHSVVQKLNFIQLLRKWGVNGTETKHNSWILIVKSLMFLWGPPCSSVKRCICSYIAAWITFNIRLCYMLKI